MGTRWVTNKGSREEEAASFPCPRDLVQCAVPESHAVPAMLTTRECAEPHGERSNTQAASSIHVRGRGRAGACRAAREAGTLMLRRPERVGEGPGHRRRSRGVDGGPLARARGEQRAPRCQPTTDLLGGKKRQLQVDGGLVGEADATPSGDGASTSEQLPEVLVPVDVSAAWSSRLTHGLHRIARMTRTAQTRTCMAWR